MKKLMIIFLLFVMIESHFGQDIIRNIPDFKLEVDDLVKQYLALDIFSGVVLVAEKGEPVYQKAFGYADRQKEIKNSIQTLFDIGSMNKTFTKIVVKQIVAESRLTLEDKLTEYVKGFADPRAKKITIQQLLDHQSGMGDYHDMAYFQAPKSERTRKAIEERILGMPLLFDPGEGDEYSNSGYVILGSVIERITGKSYYDNVKERIVEPLALEHTYLENLDQYRNLRATGYFKTPFGELRTNDQFMDVANADGGFLSTVEDIMKFYRSYYYDNILMTEEMKQNDPQFQFIRNLPPGKAPMAAGGFEGFNTAMFQIYSDDVSIIVFSNMDEPAGENLAMGILNIYRGEEPEPPALHAKMNVVQAYEKYDIAYIKDHFDELTTNYHPADPKEWILNDLGYAYMIEKKDIDKAIDMLECNTSLFPESANVWDSLGEAWMVKGDKEKAKTYYKKALSLDPELQTAINAWKKLK